MWMTLISSDWSLSKISLFTLFKDEPFQFEWHLSNQMSVLTDVFESNDSIFNILKEKQVFCHWAALQKLWQLRISLGCRRNVLMPQIDLRIREQLLSLMSTVHSKTSGPGRGDNSELLTLYSIAVTILRRSSCDWCIQLVDVFRSCQKIRTAVVSEARWHSADSCH